MFLKEMEKSCRLCPRNCRADRRHTKGYCGQGLLPRVARAALHMWEEPCLSGSEGSGAVFFSGCSLRCCFCQNHEISVGEHGKEVSPNELAEIFLKLQAQGANNINLVTPTHVLLGVIPAIRKAKAQGMTLPVVYNCGGYESVETLRELEGLIDIYLPDMKYADDRLAKAFSGASDYVEKSRLALEEMVRQCPEVIYDARGILQKGVIVRHLVLPGHVRNSKDVITYLWEKYQDRITISLMSQYTPLYQGEEYPELKRSVTRREYEKVLDHYLGCGFTGGYCQEGDPVGESFIPAFDGTGV